MASSQLAAWQVHSPQHAAGNQASQLRASRLLNHMLRASVTGCKTMSATVQPASGSSQPSKAWTIPTRCTAASSPSPRPHSSPVSRRCASNRSVFWSDTLKVLSGVRNVPHCACTAVPSALNKLPPVLTSREATLPAQHHSGAAIGPQKAKACNPHNLLLMWGYKMQADQQVHMLTGHCVISLPAFNISANMQGISPAQCLPPRLRSPRAGTHFWRPCRGFAASRESTPPPTTAPPTPASAR